MKISIIGAGSVGATTCSLLVSKDICNQIVLIDIEQDIANGKSLDIMQSAAAFKSSTKVKATSDYCEISQSDIVIITAGVPRKPGMSREDLLHVNIKIMKDIVQNIKKFATDTIIVVVSNPLDVMTYVALKLSGFAKEKVIGMGGILDSARMSNIVSENLNYGYGQVNSCVIGSHGENMLPLPRFSSINGIPLCEIFDENSCNEIVKKTKEGGANIVKLLGTSAYYAPAASICQLVEAIIKDSKAIYPCSVFLDGEYNVYDVTIGVIVMIGKNGIEKIVELPLNQSESNEFHQGVVSIKEMISIAKDLF